jgi:Flp pilus assembly pilin Flp
MRTMKNQKGAAFTEYAILAGGLSIVAISTIYALGESNSETLRRAAEQIEETREEGASGGGSSPAPAPNPEPDPGIDGAMRLTYNASNSQVTLPLYDTVNVSIDWGGPSSTCPTTVSSAGDVDCTYNEPGTYTVAIEGTLTQFGSPAWSPVSNAGNLISVDNWGETGLTSLHQAFKGASNLASVPTSLPATVTSLSGTFTNSGYNGTEVVSWDTSNVDNMSYTFAGTNFNQDISGWRTENVGTMEGMFMDASVFDQPIGNWTTTSLHNTGYMFQNAVKFNKNLDGWSMGGVTWAEKMFSGATDFDGNVSTWNMSQARNVVDMFKNATSFNGAIGSWDTMNFEYMTGMFRNATSFDANIGGWNVANVYHMNNVFQGATSFSQDLGSWNTSNADTMEAMFQDATSFDSDLSAWCVSKIGSKPANFDTGATIWTSPQPVWGSCP